ncbi:hypothetical protein XELAEV_180066251mg [Xenopus laevis]|uniref:Uncharacterized protein n=1 Tax=Xenopus laevis TaxID=8355 RepID=A0A974I3P6_XENLA|nr:hypothetical protein XELAEV_180066251mg [Xenopus laevis]
MMGKRRILQKNLLPSQASHNCLTINNKRGLTNTTLRRDQRESFDKIISDDIAKKVLPGWKLEARWAKDNYDQYNR